MEEIWRRLLITRCLSTIAGAEMNQKWQVRGICWVGELVHNLLLEPEQEVGEQRADDKVKA